MSSAFIFLVIFSYDYFFSRRMIEKNIENQARTLVLATVNRIEKILLSVEKVPENLSSFLEKGSYDRRELLELLRTVVEKNQEIYGAAIAFEPHAFDRETPHFAPYFYQGAEKIEFVDLGNKSYKYLHWDWYQIPKELNRRQWTEPYFDEGGGNIVMATYAVPFYRKGGGKREFMGIVTADVSLAWLQEAVSSIKVLQTGYGFLISRNGTLVTHPLKELIMNETIFGVAEARGDPHLREVGRRMIRGESGFFPFRSISPEKDYWIYYTPLPSNGWSLAVLFPQDELTADIDRLSRIVIVLGGIGLLLLSLAVTLIARSIARPLRAMAGATEAIATGNLDIELPALRSKDEVGRLTDSFNHMKTSLKQYIKELTETTAAKERIESELKVAHDIQMSLLPKVFPPFPHREEFDIYAVIDPAREVGGDFYDFFFVDDEHLCFVIGDVSGKGVPASLFMAVTKTLIKATSSQGIAPGEILTRVNWELSQENDSCMFVTIFCGILNTTSGEIFYSNGGHNDPFILRKGNEAAWLEGNRGLVVGAMEQTVYETCQTILQPGESIFLYTDGVTEALNTREELFSDDRLRKKISFLQAHPPEEVISGVAEEIARFSNHMPQADDIAMMMIRFHGKRKE
jgi:sigma-B regulation protein RsbU (phosphoserine phosphatase)